MSRTILTLLLSLGLATPALAQRPAARTTAAPATTTITVQVTDGRGDPIDGVDVHATGPVTRDGTTDEKGTLRFVGVRAGTYRVLFTRDGYVAFEKEVAWRSGQPAPDLAVTLTDAEPPAPPPPAPEPPPAPPAPSPGVARTLSLPEFIEQHFISNREPQKASPLGCSGLAEGLVWQVRDPWVDRQHPDADVMLYVVGGEGTLRLAERSHPLQPGTFSVVPRGATYDLSRQGRNPLILLAIVAGPHCR